MNQAAGQVQNLDLLIYDTGFSHQTLLIVVRNH